jgi:hypothetical protein
MNSASSPSPRSQYPYAGYDEEPDLTAPRRIYLSEPGWRIGVKIGSEREFCYMRAPGQEFYHRLLDGEVFVHRDDERLCWACATRRGLLVAEPKRLREAIIPLPADRETIPLDLGWRQAERP